LGEDLALDGKANC